MELLHQFPALQFVENAEKILFDAKSIHAVKLKSEVCWKETQYFFVITRFKELYVCPHYEENGTWVSEFKKIPIFRNEVEVEIDVKRIFILDERKGGIIQSVDGNWFRISRKFAKAEIHIIASYVFEQAESVLKLPKFLCHNVGFIFMMYMQFLKKVSMFFMNVTNTNEDEWGTIIQVEYSKGKMLLLDDKNEVSELHVHCNKRRLLPDSIEQDIFMAEWNQIYFDKPVKEIAACPQFLIFAAMTSDGDIYAWGEDLYLGVACPKKTSFKSLHEAFYMLLNVTYKPIDANKILKVNAHEVTQALEEHFDDQETSDLTIIVEGKPIFVHKSILRIRCAYFNNMLDGSWKETENDVVKVQEDRNYEAYRAVLFFLYTNHLKMEMSFAFDVLHLSNEFFLPNLQERCGIFIKNSVNVENVAYAYLSAVEYNYETLESFCFEYAVKNSEKFVETEGFHYLEPEIMKKFCVAFARKHGKVCPVVPES